MDTYFLDILPQSQLKVSSLRDNDSEQKTSFQLSRDFSKCKISVLGPGLTSDVTSLTKAWPKLSERLFMWQIIYLDAEEVDGFSGYESFMTYSIFILFIIFILGNGQIFILYSWTWDLKRKYLAWNYQNSIWAYESVHNLFGNNGFLIPSLRKIKMTFVIPKWICNKLKPIFYRLSYNSLWNKL